MLKNGIRGSYFLQITQQLLSHFLVLRSIRDVSEAELAFGFVGVDVDTCLVTWVNRKEPFAKAAKMGVGDAACALAGGDKRVRC